MENRELIDLLEQRMFDFDRGDPMRIQHLMKVHRFAQMIGRMEGLDAHTQFVTECAALVHDIGIHPSRKINQKAVKRLNSDIVQIFRHFL